jgi:DtxR family transcriptional regulator, Mn-dependent transcriptional regulator
MADKNSATIEDYLGIMYIFKRDGIPLVGARIADILNVSPATVSNTMKRMARDGLVDLDNPEGTCLTETGLEAARSVMRRHMLTEWMLLKMLNVNWAQTHAEAHQLEHAISEGLAEQMNTSLDDPKFCPHGNPLPGFESYVEHWVPLSEVQPGQKVIIRRIHETAEDNPELLGFLETNKLMPGTEAQLVEVLNFNQTLTLEIDQSRLPLGFSAARFIYVEIC